MKKGKGADQLGFALAKLGFADWSMINRIYMSEANWKFYESYSEGVK